jgi:transposase
VQRRAEIYGSAMADGNLFGVDLTPVCEPKNNEGGESAPLVGKPRLVRADRKQMRLESRCIDDLIPQDHRARTFWAAAERLDLSAFYNEIQSVAGHAGRPAIDPRILLVLWLYATAEGIGSARRLARLCVEHDAFRWIVGGLEICHRVVNDFRVRHGEKLDDLLTKLLAALVSADVVTLRTGAQDGTRSRASAGAASFRRRKSLEKCLQEAREQVERLKSEIDDPEDESTDGRKRAAAERAARKREEQAAAALEALEQVEESRRRNGKKSEPRASTTDPDARVMKMADGGFRPGYNCQLATDVDSRIIIAARVSNSGGDMGQIEPTLAEIERRTGEKPERYLVDGGYAKQESIQELTDAGIEVYAPPPANPKEQDPTKRQRKVPPQIEAWRARMETDEAKEIYKQRAASIETVNGDLKAHRGLTQFAVRGLERVNSVLMLTVLTYNMLRVFAIAPNILLGERA